MDITTPKIALAYGRAIKITCTWIRYLFAEFTALTILEMVGSLDSDLEIFIASGVGLLSFKVQWCQI